MAKTLNKRYQEYVLFEREDQSVGIDLLSEFIERFRETRNTTILDDILHYHFGEDRENIKKILLFFTPTEIVNNRFRFYKKKKLIQRFAPPKTPPSGKIASYKKLRAIIENGQYFSLLAQFEVLEARRIEREQRAEDARTERERRRLNPQSSPPQGKSIRTVSGGLPTLGKRR